VWDDKFTGNSYIRSDPSRIAGGDDGATIDLVWQASQPKGADVSFACIVAYGSRDWLFIQSGQSLIFLVNGTPMPLAGQGILTQRQVFRTGVTEMAIYQLTPTQVIQLSQASDVQMRLVGAHSYIERKLSEKNRADIKNFVDKILAAAK